MSEVTVDAITTQIESLPLLDQRKLLATLRAKLEPANQLVNGMKRVAPLPVPNPEPSQRWLKDHAHEYRGQWLALDGDRLIAHGPVASDVFAAADADGAYLPVLTYLEPAEAPPFAGI